jgi:ABC-type multidrug transport system fused ATPase/permease subunit
MAAFTMNDSGRTLKYSALALLKRFLPFLRPYTKKYVFALILLMVASLLSLAPPTLLKVIIDDAIKSGTTSRLDRMVLLMVLAIILSGLTKGLMEYLHEQVSARFIFDLRRHLFNRIQHQSMDFFSLVKTGEILGRLRVDVPSVYGVWVNSLLGTLSEAVQIIGITVILLYMNLTLTLLALSLVPLLYLTLTYTGKRLRELSRITRDKDVALLEFFQEKINNINVVKLYHREKYEDQNHTLLSEDFISASLRRLRYKFSSIFIVGTLTAGASVIIIWYGGHRVIEGSLSFGSLMAFYLYTVRLYGPIQSLANRSVDIYNGLASADRLIEYLDLKPSVRESDNPIRLRNIEGEVSFNNISFKYPTSAVSVINNLDLTLKPGQKVALVGASGAGKTTLVNLLCRLYDVDSGSIQIDGVDIREMEFNGLYDAVGMVSQDICLFNSTIEDNIRYGRIEADHESVVEAARKAHLHEYIEQLPDGYQTIIGARGVKLSGGQRQRLALARMILKDTKIWVLDEFTSSLDSQSEAVVYENIQPLLEGKTTLIIAHRFTTILSADQVIVLQGGNIVERGTHDTLYRKNGFYSKLFDTQLQKTALPQY